MAVVTGVHLEDIYLEHKFLGGNYYYPPQIIDYQLVCPVTDEWSTTEITHGKAAIPMEFMNIDSHDSLSDAKATPMLVSDVTCTSLLTPEMTNAALMYVHVSDTYVDPKKKKR